MRGSAPRPGRGNDFPTSRGKPASLFPPPGFAGSAGQGERDDYASEEGRTEEGRACVSSRTRSWSRPLSFFAGQRVKGRITGAVSGEKAVRKAVEKTSPGFVFASAVFRRSGSRAVSGVRAAEAMQALRTENSESGKKNA